ncbi:MAG: hypothetical protein KIG52_00345 [Muribaculaceae bacterium]|nr:hypothetical protein [Muribaculaceae bacterium]
MAETTHFFTAETSGKAHLSRCRLYIIHNAGINSNKTTSLARIDPAMLSIKIPSRFSTRKYDDAGIKS